MKSLLLLVAVLSLTSCSSVKTDWNFNQGIDFSKYQTYSWIKADSKDAGNKFNDLTHHQVVRYIEEVLESKGLKKSDYDDSDVHVNYMIDVDHKTIDRRYHNYYSTAGRSAYMGRSYAPYGYYGVSGPYYEKRMSYEKASFVIDLLDKNTRGIAWRGHASKTIDRRKNVKEQLESIKSGVDKLFRNYPPKR